MVNIGQTAVTIGLLGNREREENAFYSRSRGIPAADSPAADTPAGWRVVVLPAPTVFPQYFTASVQNSSINTKYW